jgi:hypothetical protein
VRIVCTAVCYFLLPVEADAACAAPQLIYDSSGQHKGFGFVHFQTKEEADLARKKVRVGMVCAGSAWPCTPLRHAVKLLYVQYVAEACSTAAEAWHATALDGVTAGRLSRPCGVACLRPMRHDMPISGRGGQHGGAAWACVASSCGCSSLCCFPWHQQRTYACGCAAICLEGCRISCQPPGSWPELLGCMECGAAPQVAAAFLLCGPAL